MALDKVAHALVTFYDINMTQQTHKKLADLLALADIQINGTRPWDIQVHDDAVYGRVLSKGSLGFGESYMEGQWDTADLIGLIARIVSARLDKKISPLVALELVAKSVVFNLQSPARAFQVGEEHYDLGNDIYEAMLDPRLTYTCGYWKDAKTLAEAQEAKLDLVCRKIGLDRARDLSVLDIGCGWGSFMIYAAQKYGARCTGITVSKEQIELGQARAVEAGVADRVTFILQDYRETQGSYDRVVSLGMVEHVGAKNYHSFMNVAARVLKEDGLFLLHTIGGNRSDAGLDPWLNKYIFPNSQIPSGAQLAQAAEDFFTMEDWHNFGAYYELTLRAWFENFDRAWPQLKARYSEKFYRMWKFYLLSCAAQFHTRDLQLWQIVYAKRGVPGGYVSIR